MSLEARNFDLAKQAWEKGWEKANRPRAAQAHIELQQIFFLQKSRQGSLCVKLNFLQVLRPQQKTFPSPDQTKDPSESASWSHATVAKGFRQSYKQSVKTKAAFPNAVLLVPPTTGSHWLLASQHLANVSLCHNSARCNSRETMFPLSCGILRAGLYLRG